MATRCRNARCGFDFESMEVAIPFARKLPDSDLARETTVHCPVCGDEQIDFLNERGVFRLDPTKNQWVYWRLRDSERKTAGHPPALTFGGGLRMVFTDGLHANELGLDDICYESVPAFEAQDPSAAPVVPTLPVRPEFLGYLDEKALREARAGTASPRFGRAEKAGTWTYKSKIPLRAVPANDWPDWVCGLHPATPADPLFRGLFVRLWPRQKVRTLRWRYVLASVGAADPRGLELLGRTDRSWEACAWVPARGGVIGARRELENQLEQVAVHRHGDGPLTLAAPWATKAMKRVTRGEQHDKIDWLGRPAWISLEVKDRKGAEMRTAGGVFGVLPAEEDTLLGELRLGIDFGTTNTVIAAKIGEGEIGIVSVDDRRARDTSEWILGRNNESMLEPEVNLWPGRAWAGAHRDLIPSEILAIEAWNQIPELGEKLNHWDVGVEVGIALGEPTKAHDTRVVGEFKWARAQPTKALKDNVALLQERFLEMCVLQSLGVIGAQQKLSADLHAYYSFPPAFGEGDLDALKQAAAGLKKRLAQYIDFNALSVRPGLNEAAAAATAGNTDSMFTVHVDIGGGSLELLVEDNLARGKSLSHEGWAVPVYSTSIFFGGRVFLRSLVGDGNCIPDREYTRLAAEVRAGKEILSFVPSEALARIVKRRADVYVKYVAEFVARALAAQCLEHGYSIDEGEGLPDGERPWNLARNRLFTRTDKSAPWRIGTDRNGGREVTFDLVLLGNGWGCADVVFPRDGTNLEEQVSALVQRRLHELIRAEKPKAIRISDGVDNLFDLVTNRRVKVRARSVLDPPSKTSNRAIPFLVPGRAHRKSVVAWHILQEGEQDNSQDNALTHAVLGLSVKLNEQQVSWLRPYGFPTHGTIAPKGKGRT